MRRLFSRVQRAVAVAAVAAGSVLVFAAPAAASGASISVSPSTVAAGGTVVFSGTVPISGCPQGADVILTDAALFPPDGHGPQVPRDATGSFQTSYTVPASTPPATYSIGMRCGGGNVGVRTTLRVTAQVGQTPVGAPPAGFGGASRGNDVGGWLTAGTTGTVLAGILVGVAVRRRQRIRA